MRRKKPECGGQVGEVACPSLSTDEGRGHEDAWPNTALRTAEKIDGKHLPLKMNKQIEVNHNPAKNIIGWIKEHMHHEYDQFEFEHALGIPFDYVKFCHMRQGALGQGITCSARNREPIATLQR